MGIVLIPAKGRCRYSLNILICSFVKGDSFQDLNIANLEISFIPNAKDRGCFGIQRNFTINWWSTPLTDSAHAYAPSANIVPVFYKILILLSCLGSAMDKTFAIERILWAKGLFQYSHRDSNSDHPIICWHSLGYKPRALPIRPWE